MVSNSILLDEVIGVLWILGIEDRVGECLNRVPLPTGEYLLVVRQLPLLQRDTSWQLHKVCFIIFFLYLFHRCVHHFMSTLNHFLFLTTAFTLFGDTHVSNIGGRYNGNVELPLLVIFIRSTTSLIHFYFNAIILF